MRLLHVINNLGTGGAEKLLIESLPLYKQYGIEVSILVIDGTDYPFMNQLKEMQCCEIFTLGQGGLYNPFHVFKLIKFVKNFELIHVHLFPAMYYVGIAKFLSASKTKLVFTEHSTKNTRMRYAVLRVIDRFIYKNYNLITAITPQVKQSLEVKLGLKQKVAVVYNGVNLARFKDKLPADRLLDSKILIQVSRFSADKDQETVIRSLTLLPENVQLLLIGEGPLKANCEQLVNDLKLNDRVKFLGVRLDIAELLQGSDIVIQSSNWEGFGLAAVEGMAAEKAVVVSDVPGLKEIVDGYGLTFEHKNESDLANKVRSLLLNEDFYKEVSTKCRLRADDFSINKMLDSFVALYKELVPFR